jgi:uncharacterized protein
MDTYRVDIAPLLDVLGASVDVVVDIPLERFVVGTEEFVPTAPAHFVGQVTNAGTAVIAMGRATLPATATCARCLAEFPTEIAGRVDGFYIFPGQEEGLPEEQEFEYVDSDSHVDILPAILAALTLEAPFAPLHDEECAGICAECGQDLNEGPCECGDEPDDLHPFAKLRGLLADQDTDASAGS